MQAGGYTYIHIYIICICMCIYMYCYTKKTGRFERLWLRTGGFSLVFLCVCSSSDVLWSQQHGQREGDGGRRWSRDTDALLTLTGISSSSFSASRSPCFPLPLLLLLCFSSRQLLLSVLLITMTTGPDCC